MMRVWVQGDAVRIAPQDVLGAGGEAEIYALRDDRVLKLYKPPQHPDYGQDPAAQQAARERLAQAASRIAAFPRPRPLPDHIVQPLAPALDSRRAVVGYVMRRVPPSVPLARLADPGSRAQGIDEDGVIRVFTRLHGLLSAAHDGDLILGDFNDLNVLVHGEDPYLIDVDSYQLPGFLATQYTPRFVDPLLCIPDGTHLTLARPYEKASDWYAFAVLLFQSLLFVGPYGGLYRPASPSRAVPEGLRPASRLTVFAADVRYPKAARSPDVLPEDLRAYFMDVFLHDRRGSFPLQLLHALRWQRCPMCSLLHARSVCPHCRQPRVVSVPPRQGGAISRTVATIPGMLVHVQGVGSRVTWVSWADGTFRTEVGQVCGTGPLDPWVRVARAGAGVWVGHGPVVREQSRVLRVDTFDHVPQVAVCGGRLLWLAGGDLWEETPSGPRALGQVLPNRSQVWAGETLAVVYSEAGALSTAWLAFPGRRGLTGVTLPPMRGKLVRSLCLPTGEGTWLLLARQVDGITRHLCFVLDHHGQVRASAQAEAGDGSWLGEPWGAMAAGGALFVPTECIVRVEPRGGALQPVRAFPDTADVVDPSVRLLPGPAGIYVVRPNRIDLLIQR